MAPWLVRGARGIEPLIRRCFRPTLEGVERIPSQGPFLLVANHSAGLGLAELVSFAVLYLRDVGPGRRLAGFAHPVGFRVFPLSTLLRGLGAIPSTYGAARDALGKGVPLLVFPGGDHETMRPIWQANRVDLGGRVGFLRIAREAGVPIVPLGIRGSHLTAPVLVRSRLLATLLVAPRLFGAKRWGVSLLAVLGAALIAALVPAPWPVRALLIWLWLGSPLTFVPWVPWRLRLRVGSPLPASDLFAGEPDEAQLRRALSRVEGTIQSLVD